MPLIVIVLLNEQSLTTSIWIVGFTIRLGKLIPINISKQGYTHKIVQIQCSKYKKELTNLREKRFTKKQTSYGNIL